MRSGWRQTLLEMVQGSGGRDPYNRHGFGEVLSYLCSGIFQHLMAPFTIDEQRGVRHRDIPATIVACAITALIIAGLIFVLYHTETLDAWEHVRRMFGW